MKERLKKNLLLISGVIIRFIIVPFSSEKLDFYTQLIPLTEGLTSGGLLYQTVSWGDMPLFPLICTLMQSINPFQATAISNLFLSIPLILADVGIVLSIYFICRKFFDLSENKSLLVSALYYLNPRVIAEVYIGHFDNITVLLILGSLLLLFKSNDSNQSKNQIYMQLLSGLVLGLAILTRMYVLIFLPLFIVINTKMNNIKKSVVQFGAFLGTLIAGILPFLIITPSAFFSNLGSSKLLSGFNKDSIWYVFSQHLPTFGITFISDTALNIISYVLTGIICAFIIGVFIFKKEEVTKNRIIQVFGIFSIGFATLYCVNLTQYYTLFIPFLLPAIFAKNQKYNKEERFYKVMIIQFILLGLLSITDLAFVISSMPSINPVYPGSDSYVGVFALFIYFVASILIYWLENLEYLQSDELVKITQFVIVGISGTLITWVVLYLLVDFAAIPEWLAYFLAYSSGIINNFIWNRMWTFRSESKRVRIELVKYILSNFVGFGGYWAVSSTLFYGFKMNYFVSNIIGTAISFTINYLLTRFWTFNYQYYYQLTPISDEKKPFSIILPMYNEELIARKSTTKTIEFLRKHYSDFELIIAEHGATDKTPEIAANLAQEYPEITHIHIEEVLGRGESLTNAIRKAKNNIVMFMDADLAVKLDAIPTGIGKAIAGVDLVYGDRYHPDSKTDRHLLREIFSRAYNIYLRMLFRDKVADHQCGFKIFNKKAIIPILDQMEDFNWFWDSEIIIRSKIAGLKLEPISVHWSENRDFKETKVNFLKDIRMMGSAAIKLKKSLRREKKKRMSANSN